MVFLNKKKKLSFVLIAFVYIYLLLIPKSLKHSLLKSFSHFFFFFIPIIFTLWKKVSSSLSFKLVIKHSYPFKKLSLLNSSINLISKGRNLIFEKFLLLNLSFYIFQKTRNFFFLNVKNYYKRDYFFIKTIVNKLKIKFTKSFLLKKINVNLDNFLSIIIFSLKYKDLNLLKSFFKKTLVNLQIKSYKLFFSILRTSLKLIQKPYFNLFNVLGIKILIKGKIGTSGNSKKKKINLIFGSISSNSRNKIFLLKKLSLKTSSGQLGLIFLFNFKN